MTQFRATLVDAVHPKCPDRPLVIYCNDGEGAKTWARTVLKAIDAGVYPNARVQIDEMKYVPWNGVKIAEVQQ